MGVIVDPKHGQNQPSQQSENQIDVVVDDVSACDDRGHDGQAAQDATAFAADAVADVAANEGAD